MRTFDFAPLYRASVGFDRFAQLIDQMSGLDADSSVFPPYNIERLGDNDYRITMAVAGFADTELKLELNEQVLTVTGEKPAEDKASTGKQYLHRGIAGRTFARRFQLADHVEVKAAALKDGLLHIDLVRNVPERLKPRQIAIGADATVPRQLAAA